MLHTPFYAGAYVWGRRPSEVRLADGKLVRKQGALRAPEGCQVFLPDHHEGYIAWSEYQENQRRVRGNNLKVEPGASVAAARSARAC